MEKSDSFIIRVQRNKRFFYITKTYELTWRKEWALSFNSKNDIEEELRNNRMFKLSVGDWYDIINYDNAVSY